MLTAMEKEKIISLFDEEFEATHKDAYKQYRIRNERDLIRFLKYFTKLEEEDTTPYKHKNGYYSKKAHYVNGRRVNRQVYNYLKKWMEIK